MMNLNIKLLIQIMQQDDLRAKLNLTQMEDNLIQQIVNNNLILDQINPEHINLITKLNKLDIDLDAQGSLIPFLAELDIEDTLSINKTRAAKRFYKDQQNTVNGTKQYLHFIASGRKKR